MSLSKSYKEIEIRGKKFIVITKPCCPICGKEMTEDEDETVWRCHNKDCPVGWVQIVDKKHGNPITDEKGFI